MNPYIFLVIVGFLAGALNAAAGGGSFITFPALVYSGLPALSANASSTLALLPGSLASIYAYRREIRPFPGTRTIVFMSITLAGGTLGAVLLLGTSGRSFEKLVPWLLLVAALVFAFADRLSPRKGFSPTWRPSLLYASQLVLGVYGGYFGGAVGLLMLTVWRLLKAGPLDQLNANKTLLVTLANAAACLLFALSGVVAWPQAGTMMAATTCGGYIGARCARRLPVARLKKAISVLNFIITALFFYFYYRR
jgi:hypothetical protein